MSEHKPLNFRGSALADLRAFPATVRQEVGYQLDKVQRGLEPKDWKPMATVGQGVREIRIRDANGAFRVVYVAKLAEAVYVSCTASRRKPRRRVRRISTWPKPDTAPC